MNKAEKIWLDGKLVNWEDAQVHILTHALHYGVGVFEGLRAYKTADGRSAIFRLHDHIQRLFDSAHIMLIDIPYSIEQLKQACVDTLKANHQADGYIRPIAFFGDGSMGVGAKNPVRVSVASWPWGAYLSDEGLSKGIRAKVSSFARMYVNANLVRAKVCGQYVNSFLANREATMAGYDEAILLDTEGYVSEGSGENIYIVKNGTIFTPSLASPVLAGITRDSILRIARDAGIPVVEQKFTRDTMYLADELFMTGTAAEITPVREVDNRRIGAGLPGPVTKKLQENYFRAVRGEDTCYREWLTTY